MSAQFITNVAEGKVSVILSLADYEELIDDLEDLAAIAERNDEATKSFEVALKEIGYDQDYKLPQALGKLSCDQKE